MFWPIVRKCVTAVGTSGSGTFQCSERSRTALLTFRSCRRLSTAINGPNIVILFSHSLYWIFPYVTVTVVRGNSQCQWGRAFPLPMPQLKHSCKKKSGHVHMSHYSHSVLIGGGSLLFHYQKSNYTGTPGKMTGRAGCFSTKLQKNYATWKLWIMIFVHSIRKLPHYVYEQRPAKEFSFPSTDCLSLCECIRIHYFG